MNNSRILPNPLTWLNLEQSRIENWKISMREALLEVENGAVPFKKPCPQKPQKKESKRARWVK